MLVVKKRHFFKYWNVWFPDKDSCLPNDCDVCCMIGTAELRNENSIGNVCYNSLISSLEDSTEELYSGFSKVTKYDIRRSERDELMIYHYPSDFLKKHNDIFRDFESVYNEMYRSKGLSAVADIKGMKNVMKYNGLLISCARCGESPLAYHAYIVDGNHARLWMSASVFRQNEDKQIRAKVGRANKRLHYEDLLYFKNLGYVSYDWGGVSSLENPNGIDCFKMSFGGKPIHYYDETFICSGKYNLFYKIKKRILMR